MLLRPANRKANRLRGGSRGRSPSKEIVTFCMEGETLSSLNHGAAHSKWYTPEATAKTAAPLSARKALPPLAWAAGLPLSITLAVSFVGT